MNKKAFFLVEQPWCHSEKLHRLTCLFFADNRITQKCHNQRLACWALGDLPIKKQLPRGLRLQSPSTIWSHDEWHPEMIIPTYFMLIMIHDDYLPLGRKLLTLKKLTIPNLFIVKQRYSNFHQTWFQENLRFGPQALRLLLPAGPPKDPVTVISPTCFWASGKPNSYITWDPPTTSKTRLVFSKKKKKRPKKTKIFRSKMDPTLGKSTHPNLRA